MSDLVERLTTQLADTSISDQCADLLIEAADEITRLRAEVEWLRREVKREQAEAFVQISANERLRAEVEALRASIGAIHCRVCHGSSTYGMAEAIASECEHAVPALKELRK